jgi:hypothetical protein
MHSRDTANYCGDDQRGGADFCMGQEPGKRTLYGGVSKVGEEEIER